jgi:hypothetical protein
MKQTNLPYLAMERGCEGCCWWEPHTELLAEAGSCHRRAPTAGPHQPFPSTRYADWCGDFGPVEPVPKGLRQRRKERLHKRAINRIGST